MSIYQVHLAGAVDAYAEAHLVPPTDALTHALTHSTANGIPMIAVSPSQGKFLSLLTSMSGARNVLEIGTLGGYSSIWFTQALKGKGKVTSIEIDPSRRAVAIQILEYAGIKVPKEVEVILGAALDVLPTLMEEIERGERERFDFVFVDADWERQWEYFDWGVRLSKGKGSVVYVDNVVREMIESGIVGGGILEGERDGEDEKWRKKEEATDLCKKVGSDERVEGVVMQTVGAKDYDGFLMAIVK